MSHLPDEQLSALADGALAGGERAAAERHLEGCAHCREELALLVAQDRALASTLEHDPGEAYFESFVGRVGGRIRAAGLRGAQSREPESRSLAEWFRSPRKLALVAAVATVVAGAGIVMLSTREVRVAALREREIESRVAQEAPVPAPVGPSSVQPPAGVPVPPSPLATLAPPPAAQPPATGAVHPPGGPAPNPGVVSRDQSGAPARNERAPLNRAYEVRRNAAGEDVPVHRPGEFVYRPQRPAPASRPAAPGEPVHVRKPEYAEPLGAGPRVGMLRGGAQPAPTDEAGSVSASGQTAPAAVAKAALGDDSQSVVAPSAENAVGARRDLAMPGRAPGLAERGLALQVRGTPEAFDGLPAGPRALARNAQRLTTLAEGTGRAPAWDSAAAGWERLIEGVQGGPLESETRFQAARARFMAWQRGASASRAARAMQALGGFLEHAPLGAEQDSARAWRAGLKK